MADRTFDFPGLRKVARIDTIRAAEYPNLLWVQVHDSDGAIGLGETFFGPAAAEAYIHETAAPYLLGQDPNAIEAHASQMSARTTHRSMGAEARGQSAIDIALWDLRGKALGLPVYAALGGPVRPSIRIYNTCAGYGYVRKAFKPGQAFGAVWGMGEHEGPYEDLVKWQLEGRAGELAQELLEQGITAMKIWPFDQMIAQSGGLHLTLEQIEEGMEPFRQIRRAVGKKMEIAVELHSGWSVPAALQLFGALEEIEPMWFEDPIPMDNVDALAELASKTKVPITASETLTGRYAFRELLERKAVGIAMLDPGWVGGISEAMHIASLAQAYHRPVAPHDCTGPIAYVAGCHLCLAAPNGMIQEGVRAYYGEGGWYADVLTALPIVENGTVRPPEGPGLGTELLPDFTRREGVTVQTSGA